MLSRSLNPRYIRRMRKFARRIERVIRCANGCLIQGTNYLRFAPVYVPRPRDPSAFRREPRARE